MQNKELFRKEALNARNASRPVHGDVLLYLPSSYRLVIILIVTAFILLVGTLLFGSYTKRVSVHGELLATHGALPVYLPKAGIIKEYYVKEEQRVEKDAPLFLVSTEVFGAGSRGTSSEKIKLLHEQKNLVLAQLDSEEQVFKDNQSSLDQKILSQRSEAKLIATQILEIKRKNSLLSESLKKYEEARTQDAISDDAIIEKTISALNSKIDLNERERQLESLHRDIAALELERKKSASDLNKTTLTLKAELLTLEEQILAVEYEKGMVIKAPQSGTVTAIQGVNGSYYDNTKPVTFLMPSTSELEARLLVPASAIGFINKGDVTYLRYSAFPYQQFGQGKGRIYSISETSLAPTDISMTTGSSATEPMYLVKVELESSFVKNAGKVYRLKPGLLLDADIMLEHRKIYEWMLRPFFAISERSRQFHNE
ncbi:HlyD family secretion protein [Pseudomonas sp. COR18]|uniref:HlyD family secretion protein n=1 Tax=Pseudomonas sp. COR18 TaxID=3399680 RepID=UPI003AFF7E1D